MIRTMIGCLLSPLGHEEEREKREKLIIDLGISHQHFKRLKRIAHQQDLGARYWTTCRVFEPDDWCRIQRKMPPNVALCHFLPETTITTRNVSYCSK